MKKLLYFQEAGSQKHMRDIAGVIRVQGSALDRAYLTEWATRLDVRELWDQVLAVAEPSD